jgi:hypothetical protein
LKISYPPSLVIVAASFLLTLGVFQPYALGKPQTQGTKSEQIEVRLIPKKKAIKAGEALEVRVEIWNVGSNPVFIEKDIYQPCGRPGPLSLRLELGPAVNSLTEHGCGSDCIYEATQSFASRLLLQWTTLPVGNFYGTVVTMEPEDFPQLNTPGRWRLSGTYKFLGELSLSLCGYIGPIPDDKEQIKGLPYKTWRGTAETNKAWIDVTGGASPSKVKKSP